MAERDRVSGCADAGYISTQLSDGYVATLTVAVDPAATPRLSDLVGRRREGDIFFRRIFGWRFRLYPPVFRKSEQLV